MASLKALCPPRLYTARLELVCYDEHNVAHLDCLLASVNSPQSRELSGDTHVRTHEDLIRYLSAYPLRGPRWAGGVSDIYMVAYMLRARGSDGKGGDEDERPLMGAVTIEQQLLRNGDLLPPDIGWALVPEYMGRGYATEAAAELLRCAREEMGMDELCVLANERNAPSNRVAEKLGFTDGGRVFCEDEGLWMPVWTLPHMGKLEIKGTLNLAAQIEDRDKERAASKG